MFKAFHQWLIRVLTEPAPDIASDNHAVEAPNCAKLALLDAVGGLAPAFTQARATTNQATPA